MGDGNTVDLGTRLAGLLVRSGLIALAVALVAGAVVVVRSRRRPDGPATAAMPAVEPRGRRFLRIGTAALWIVDGLLQMQPLMPAGFVPNNIEPHVAAEPAPLSGIVSVLTRAWERHPVVADAAVVWLEVGLGLLLLVCRRGRSSRIAAWSAVAVGAAIWVFGEALGGLLESGAGWLTGAPGAALVYVAAAALLLLPWSWWTTERAALLIRHLTAAWFVLAAVLQIIPGEGFWTGAGLAAPFVDGAAMTQPSWLNAPMRSLAVIARDNPAALNLTVILLLLAVAAWLELDTRSAPVVAGIVLCLLTWWLGQDFGVLGGTATDPNTALPLALLVAGALPHWRTASAAEPTPERVRRWLVPSRQAGVVLAAVLTFAVPAVLAVTLFGPPDSAALAADSSGGLRTVPARTAPSFSLVDQDGRHVTSAALRGKIVVITFLDPVCSSECPLIAGQLAAADRALGPLAARVQIIAIDSNPVFHSVSDVAAFTDSHGLAPLSNWHFLCGGPAYTQGVLAEFGMAINVPTVGMIEHSSGVFFLSASGREAAYLDDGAADELTASYAQVVERELRTLAQ